MPAHASRRLRTIATTVLLILAGQVVLSTSARAAEPSTGPAIFHNGVWHLRTTPTSGAASSTFPYGRADDIPVMGDWNGDGIDTIGS